MAAIPKRKEGNKNYFCFSDSNHDAADDENGGVRLRVLRLCLPWFGLVQLPAQVTKHFFRQGFRMTKCHQVYCLQEPQVSGSNKNE